MNIMLAAVDLKPGSGRVVARAAMLAGQTGARLHLVHVIDEAMVLYEPMVEISVRRRLHQGASEALQALVAQLPAGMTVSIEQHVLLGKPAQTVARKAAELQAEVVLAGQHHMEPLQALLFGSTVERLLHYCTMPVLVVGGQDNSGYRQIVAATDFSRCSRHALLAGLALAPAAGVCLVHVLEPPLLSGLLHHDAIDNDSLLAPQQARIEQEVKEEMASFIADHEKGRIMTRILTGEVRPALTAAVTETGAQLLVLGYHGRHGIGRLLAGNLARHFLSEPPCDVLIAR